MASQYLQAQNEGITHLQQEQYSLSISLLENCCEQNPEDFTNYLYLGLAYFLQGNRESAEEVWTYGLLGCPDFDDNVEKLLQQLDYTGISCFDKGHFELALHIYQKVEELLSDRDTDKSEYAGYYCNIGFAYDKQAYLLSNQQYVEQAKQAYLKAISLNKNLILAYGKLGNLYSEIQELKQAEQNYRKQIQHNPNNANGYLSLINNLQLMGRTKEAIEIAEERRKKYPDELVWQLKKYFTLPLIYQSGEEIKEYKRLFHQGLTHITNLINSGNLDWQKAFNAIILHNNFRLAYQCFNHKELQQQYANLVQTIINATCPLWTQNLTSSSTINRSKIRVGYVSEAFYNHVVARLSRGWFYHYDRNKFETYIYSISPKIDKMSQEYQENSDYFYHLPNDLDRVIKQIREDELDILVFLDIGMFAPISILASLRLAPIQCTTWFHPETSGFNTIDYFLSSNLMEPDNAEEHYSETLIRLPNLAISYSKPEIPPITKTKKDFGLKEDVVTYLCCQSIFKYLPQHDYMLASIAKQVPDSQFVFMARPNYDIALVFKQRLAKAFEEQNLDIDRYCVFVPILLRDNYLNLNLICDVFLDSLGWSGGNTTLEAIACKLPVVTCPGEFMRGRHSYAILKMLKVTETIAQSKSEYIDIAVKLGLDSSWRQKIVQNIEANHPYLYDDLECIKGLEEFYQQVVPRQV